MHTRIRIAVPGDAPQMVDLLNPIIALGGTTAHLTPFDADRMRAHYIQPTKNIVTHVAISNGRLSGFQNLAWPSESPNSFPDNWAVIASFVGANYAGHGVGKRLFAATRQAAGAAGVTTIDATIRADNASGLGYYGAMGFVEYDRRIGIPLRDGTPIDRIRKRFDL